MDGATVAIRSGVQAAGATARARPVIGQEVHNDRPDFLAPLFVVGGNSRVCSTRSFLPGKYVQEMFIIILLVMMIAGFSGFPRFRHSDPFIIVFFRTSTPSNRRPTQSEAACAFENEWAVARAYVTRR